MGMKADILMEAGKKQTVITTYISPSSTAHLENRKNSELPQQICKKIQNLKILGQNKKKGDGLSMH